MLGFDRTAARYAWTTALVVLLLALVYEVRATIFLFILALLFAYLLSPAVNLLDRAFSNRTRTLALAIVYVVFVAIVVAAVTQIGSRVVDEARALAGRFPARLEQWRQESGKVPETLQEQLVANARAGIMQKTNEIIAMLPNAGMRLISAASNIIYIVIVPILAFFFLKDGPQIRDNLLQLIEGGPFYEGLAKEILAAIHELLARYIRALVVLSLSTFVCYSAFFAILRVPYGLLMAVLAAILEFIPMIGPLVAGTLIVIVAGASGVSVLWLVIVMIAFRIFQDYVFSPLVMGRGVEIHPLLVMFGVFAGAEVGGIAGCFLSVPVLALTRIFYRRIHQQRIAQ